MADARLQVIIDARDRSARAFQTLSGRLDRMKTQLRAGGAALTAFGAAGAVAFGKMVSSSLDQQVGIARLERALKNVGKSYGDLTMEVEGTIEALQRKTNFGDEAQREALTQLISISANYEDALAALPVTLDLAAAKQMDLASASTLLARSLNGEAGALSRYGIALEKGASSTEVLTAITAKFGGMAEATANPVSQLKNRLGDVFQVMGDALLPTVSKIAVAMEKFSRMLQAMDPRILQVVAVVGALAAAAALIVGPFLIFLSMVPFIVAGFTMMAGSGALFSASILPITLIVLGIVAAISAVILVIQNWDRIMKGATRTLDMFKTAAVQAFSFVKDNAKRIFGALADIMLAPFILAVSGMLKVASKIPIIGGKASAALEKLGAFSSIAGAIESAQHGGISAGGMALVVERGPELVTLPGGPE